MDTSVVLLAFLPDSVSIVVRGWSELVSAKSQNRTVKLVSARRVDGAALERDFGKDYRHKCKQTHN